MAHITELSSALQTALNRNVVFNRPEAHVVLDPDGDAIDLSAYVADADVAVRKQKGINPDESLGRITISEVTIKFLNINNYFSPEYTDGPFYYTGTKLYADYTHGGTTIDVPKNFAVKTGLTLVVRSGKYSDSAVIASIDTSDSYYDRITFTAALSASTDYSAGAVVETKYRVGDYITIATAFKGSGAPTDEIAQYKGVISALPKLSGAYAYVTIQDTLRDLLTTQLRANTTKSRLSNTSVNLKSSLTISREDASTGLLSENGISINEYYCKIGAWNIAFTDATTFEVTDPGGVKYEGSTTTDFYAGDTTIYQLHIPTTAWTGAFEQGDEIDFNTFCTICYATHGSNGNTVPKIIELLLTETFAANLSSADYDTTAVDRLKSDFSEYRAGITFENKISVLKAIEVMMRHINAAMFVQNNGPVSFNSYKPQLEPDDPNTLSPDADIRAAEMEIYTRKSRVIGKYDYSGGLFNKEFSYPFNEGEPHVELLLPAFTADERIYAEAIARRIYTMWERGVKVYKIEEKWNHGVGFDINDQFAISSDYPAMDSAVVEVFSLNKVVNHPGKVEALVYDTSYNYDRYLFLDVHRLDDGRVLW